MTHWNARELARYFDHTALKPETSQQEIEKLCAEAVELGTATVCVNPIWIETAAKILKDSEVVPIAVIGFPLGSSTTATKVFETKDALRRGAREIDMVLSVGAWKSGRHESVREDIRAVKQACNQAPLKVIFETALLNHEDITLITKWCAEDQIDFVKTSTGFANRGASVQDILLMKAAIASVPGAKTKIKASGGIRTLGDSLSLIEAGAERLGASATANIIQELTGGAPIKGLGY